MTKTYKTLFIINAILIVFCLAVICYSWWQIKQIQINMGLVEPNFPYRMYSGSELEKLFNQNPGADVATVRSAEDTHAMFINYLKKGDIDNAVECCVAASKREDIKQMIQGAKDKGMYDLMLNDISQIEPEMVFDNSATYIYAGTLGEERVGNIMKFIKNTSGIWLVESF